MKFFIPLARTIAAAVVPPIYAVVVNLFRRATPQWNPRIWSNRELAKFAALYEGRIVNVSGWNDEDTEGRRYADYFTNKSEYVVSNYGGARGDVRGADINLDIQQPLAEELAGSFDVVFNHTTLEHIKDVNQAFDVLCGLSRDSVIVVVPFLQHMHWEPGSWEDYWRYSPLALEYLFEQRGLKVVYLSFNDNPVHPIYCFCVATRHPERWADKYPAPRELVPARSPGSSWQKGRFVD